MLEVWTAQYRYNGPDRLDITAKSKDPLGKYFAPTWDLVLRYKDKSISEEEYTQEYLELMHNVYRKYPNVWRQLLSRKRVVLVCFCRPNTFCHRILLARILEKLGATYKGEIILTKGELNGSKRCSKRITKI